MIALTIPISVLFWIYNPSVSKVVAKPDEVTCAFRPSSDSIELSPKQGYEDVDIRIHDLGGQSLSRAGMGSPTQKPKTL